MAQTSTEQLAADPDAALLERVAFVQRQALQTQSEAYQYVTTQEHPDIAPGDVIEIRCAPQPAITVTDGASLPPAQPSWAGYVLVNDETLYRCWGEPGPDVEGEPDQSVKDAVNNEVTQAIEPTDTGYRIISYSWVRIDPSWAARALTPDADSQLRVFAGMAGEQAGTVTIHPDMAIGENRPVEN